MRLAAQAKAGFYPAPPEAIDEVLKYLRPPAKGKFAIIDPCAGEGTAIKHLAEKLGCPIEDAYAIELDGTRAKKCREESGLVNVIGPCSYFGTVVQQRSLSLVWCNPPFDDELGGGARVESRFFDEATKLLCKGGIMLLVCPERIANNHYVRETIGTWYDNVRMVRFPEEHRKYQEVVMICVKRNEMASVVHREDSPYCSLDEYHLPNSKGPGYRFYKNAMTDEELLKAMSESPATRLLDVASDYEMARPPLALGVGHIALLLASGHLDGVVRPPDELPHLVRGTVTKQESVVDQESECEGNVVKTKTTIAERIVLEVRVVTAEGELKTFVQTDAPPDAPVEEVHPVEPVENLKKSDGEPGPTAEAPQPKVKARKPRKVKK